MVAIFTDNINEIIASLKSTKILAIRSFLMCFIIEVVLDSKNKFIIVSTGYGKANIGAAFAYATNYYNIDYIIGVGNCGVARSVSPRINDIAISQDCIQCDVDFTPIGTTAPKMVGINRLEYKADKKLIDLAKFCCSELNYKNLVLRFGSADAFMSSTNCLLYNKLRFYVDAFDTEAGVIGQLAYTAKIPFVYVKGISNFSDNNGAKMYKENYLVANESSVLVALEMIRSL